MVGINKEIIEQACRRLGVTPVFSELPWKRALEYTKNDQVDAIFSLFKNAERSRHYHFPAETLNRVKMVLLTNRDRQMNIETLADLRGTIVGVYLGSSYGQPFDTADWITKEPATTNQALRRKQSAGRTDVVVMDERVARCWCQRLNMQERFRVLDYVITENPTYVAFSKAREAKTGIVWATRFSDVLRQMKDEGVVATINANYRF